jgi:predicted methyltransferase
MGSMTEHAEREKNRARRGPVTSQLVLVAQGWMARALQAGDIAVDATAGNGVDTAFLAGCVGAAGRVYAFDVQPIALEETARRLAAAASAERVTLVNAGHETLRDHIPQESHGKIRGVMFNLGYLPGGDVSITTQVETTLAALEQACDCLAPGGLITAVRYTGHSGGREESDAVAAWAATLEGGVFHVLECSYLNQNKMPPELLCIEKRG